MPKILTKYFDMKIELKISKATSVTVGACKANANNTAMGCCHIIWC